MPGIGAPELRESLVKLVYFAWVRERVGLDEEMVQLPAGVVTVADLLHWLKGRGANYEAALQAPESIRVAIDQEHVDHSEPLAGASEIAIFPPMTGG
ncbi:molybdopterin synthase sulfur carrier subunit [Aureimonas endophytica]|uniref:Molybdopterin synthase sulfur carrier subunit n=1 Tax=Aureimonas endophytica TaxID=2027858 RepID=A0A917E0S6_9HYPH|nr:molybdopterin converting factor subunit 1 [Aureimonas endophytica]GGD85779.1 molybdopterin synthase sulfur carrier subunit [Aureimonas endophytica]